MIIAKVALDQTKLGVTYDAAGGAVDTTLFSAQVGTSLPAVRKTEIKEKLQLCVNALIEDEVPASTARVAYFKDINASRPTVGATWPTPAETDLGVTIGAAAQTRDRASHFVKVPVQQCIDVIQERYFKTR